MNQFPSKNYFTLPNEIFSLGLGAGEIAVYAYLRCLENRSTYQCWPSYATIGKAIGRTKNTVMQYVDALSEKGLISTEPTSVLTKSRIKKNGNLRYTIRPIHEAVEIFHTRQLSAVERATERSIKPFTVGRKNWLFANTPQGATGSAVIYSLLQTAMENNLKPYQYLVWLLKTANTADLTDLHTMQSLLPWNAPAECYMPQK